MERAELTFSLSELPVSTPTARTATHWITMGLDEDLDTAALLAVERHARSGSSESFGVFGGATALAPGVGSHVDLRVTQLVNETKGVHACLPSERT